MDILEVLKADYQRFPRDQTYSIYAEQVYFQDPLSRFRGVSRYRQMISLIEAWFRQPQLTLHQIKRLEHHIETRWTLTWQAPLPWQPRITISGWSELKLNDQNLIISHIDYWQCSPWSVLRQHLGRKP